MGEDLLLPSIPMAPCIPFPPQKPLSAALKPLLEEIQEEGEIVEWSYNVASEKARLIHFQENTVGVMIWLSSVNPETQPLRKYVYHLTPLTKQDQEQSASSNRSPSSPLHFHLPSMATILAWNCRGAKNPCHKNPSSKPAGYSSPNHSHSHRDEGQKPSIC